MQNILSFLKSRQFFVQLAIILGLIFLILFGTLKWLSAYTNHGKFVTVPDFRQQSVKQLDEFIKDKNLNYQIIDSIYDPKEKPGIVLRQDPEMNTEIKHNRTVYLYVTSMVAPQITMPKLINRSERQARQTLIRSGLKVGKVSQRTADCNGCVLEQLMNGVSIEPGTGVKKGSVIELVVGVKDNFYRATDSTAAEPEEDVSIDPE